MQRARLDAWVANWRKCLGQREKRRRRRHKLYLDTLTSHVSEVDARLIGQVNRIELTEESDDPKMPSKIMESDSKLDRKQKNICQPRRATQIVLVPFLSNIFITVESKWFIKYVG